MVMALVSFSIQQSFNRSLLSTSLVSDTLLGPEAFRGQVSLSLQELCIHSLLYHCSVLISQQVMSSVNKQRVSEVATLSQKTLENSLSFVRLLSINLADGPLVLIYELYSSISFPT